MLVNTRSSLHFWRGSGMKRLCSIDLRDLHGRHDGFVVERPSSLVLIWKDFRLDNFIQTQNFRDGIKITSRNWNQCRLSVRVCVCVNLQRQESSSAINQVNTRQAVLDGYVLCPELLLHGDGVSSSTFHCGVIGDNHAPQTTDSADPWWKWVNQASETVKFTSLQLH